jgi:aminopeptidase N
LQVNTALKPEVLETPEQVLSGDIPDSFLLNRNRTGFFRVVYDPEHLEKLAGAVKAGEIGELDRLGVLADSFEAAKAGYGSTVDALKLLEAYKDEAHAAVWDIIAAAIGGIRVVMDDEGVRNGLKPYVRELAAKQAKRLGWEEKPTDSHFDKLLRPTALGLSSYGEDPAIVKEALKLFNAMKQPEDVHPDLRGVVYGTAARKGGRAEFDKMLAMHNASKNSEERVTLGSALTSFEQPELIKLALAEITGDNVRLQDAPYWIAYSFMNRFGRRMTWEWMKENWDWLQQNLGTDLSFFRLPIYAARGVSDESFLPEFKEFFEKNLSPAFERPIKQAVETIQWQAAWKKRDLAAIKAYFKT